MKKILFAISLGLMLVFTSCGDQHKAQSLVKDFLQDNLKEGNDCSFERFSQLTPTAMIGLEQVKTMRKDMDRLPYIKSGINYQDGSLPDTLLYIRATYKLQGNTDKEEELTQTFYMDKGLTRVIAFKQN